MVMLAATLALALLVQGVQDGPAPKPDASILPGAVTGQVRTVDDVPAVNVRVIALAVPKFGTPDLALNYFSIGDPVQQTLTDNQGNYTLVDLPPNNYYILAGAAGKGTYYPNSPVLHKAEPVTVQSSVLADSINLKLLNRLGGKISGRVNADMSQLGPRVASLSGAHLEELLEVPVSPQGTYEFGHVPPGKYLLSLQPPTPGIASMPITVGDEDLSGLTLVPLPTKRVSGRIISRNGPIPYGILGFYTEKTYVGGKISENGTFSVELHSTRHQIDFAGLPIGYSLATVKIGNEDMTQRGIVVGNQDVSDVVITVNAPTRLATIRGKVTGLPANRFTDTIVELIGPTFNRLHADIQQDATFEFPTVVPGLYKLVLKGIGAEAQLPEMAPTTLVVDAFRTFEVSIAVPAR
jgi:hypothetical protein